MYYTVLGAGQDHGRNLNQYDFRNSGSNEITHNVLSSFFSREFVNSFLPCLFSLLLYLKATIVVSAALFPPISLTHRRLAVLTRKLSFSSRSKDRMTLRSPSDGDKNSTLPSSASVVLKTLVSRHKQIKLQSPATFKNEDNFRGFPTVF